MSNNPRAADHVGIAVSAPHVLSVLKPCAARKVPFTTVSSARVRGLPPATSAWSRTAAASVSSGQVNTMRRAQRAGERLIGGRLPVNIHGDLLSLGQPGRAAETLRRPP